LGAAYKLSFGKKNPQWYACTVKADNCDGTIKVQWEDGKKFTKRLPVHKFRLEEEQVDDTNVPFDIFAPNVGEGDY